MVFGRRKRERERDRAELQEAAARHGWRWRDAAEPPAPEIREAVFRAVRPHKHIWTTGLADVVDGTHDAAPFVAGRLVGYAYSTTNQGTPGGNRVTTNVVWRALPAALPEIRFVDGSGQATTDLGLTLPPITTTGLSPRWRVEGFTPAFAADLLTPAFRAALETAPAGTTVVLRAGVAIATGHPRGDEAAVRARLDLLAAITAAVPDGCWGRADALVAGTGVFPFDMTDGAGLDLRARLVRPDWQGYGLAKIPWQDAPTAPRMVVLRHSEAVDVWDVAPGGGTLSAGLRVGNAQIGGPARRPDIPTVASTLLGGSPQP
ncbi:hypothetical protein [Microbacterium sp. GXF7504]